MLKKIFLMFVIISAIGLVSAAPCPAEFPPNFICDDNKVIHNFILMSGDVHCAIDPSNLGAGWRWLDCNAFGECTFRPVDTTDCYDAVEDVACCPTGAGDCDTSTDQCRPDIVRPKICSAHNDSQAVCEGLDFSVFAKNEIEIADPSSRKCFTDWWAPIGGDTCEFYKGCLCKWNASDGGHCDAVVNISYDNCVGGSSPAESGRCVRHGILLGQCDGQVAKIPINWMAKWEGTPNPGNPEFDGCINDNGMIACPNAVKLGFFSLFHLIIAILILIIVYYFYSKTRKIKIKKPKKKSKGKK